MGTGRGENEGFEGYLGESDKIDGNWARSSKLVRKINENLQIILCKHLGYR